MDIDEIKKEIITLWFKHPMHKLTTFDILKFYAYLQKERSDLLDFEYDGDKYQVIRAWIEGYKFDNTHDL